MKMNYNFKTLFANKSEPKDLEIFFRCLTLRATEIIVQSRLGEKVSTPCKLHPCAPDWFNLNVSDLPEVVYEAKKVLNIDLLITRKFPFCVEISLRTAEGDNMILETWCIRIVNEPIDSNVTCSHLYGVMGLLLKSLISVTRVTPAYKLSRRQGPDSYVICYRMYMDEPTHHSLGEGYKDVRFGQIITPVGAFQLTCAYRTKMTISPTQNSRESSILMLKSDHFNTNNLSPNNRRRYNENDSHTSSLSETMKIGAFAERKKKHFDELQLDLPFCTFFADKISLNAEPMENNAPSTESSLDDDDDDDDEDLRRTSPLENNERLKQKIEDSTVDDDDESFSSAQQQRNNNEKNGNISNQIIESSTTATTTTTTLSTGDDFIMKTPFAKPSGEKVELTKFFREWQQAPLLETFKEMPPVEATDLQRQLETFESDLNEFDNIVQTLCQSSPNNN